MASVLRSRVSIGLSILATIGAWTFAILWPSTHEARVAARIPTVAELPPGPALLGIGGNTNVPTVYMLDPRTGARRRWTGIHGATMEDDVGIDQTSWSPAHHAVLIHARRTRRGTPTTVIYALDRRGHFDEVLAQPIEVLYGRGCDFDCSAMPDGTILCAGQRTAADHIARVPTFCAQALAAGAIPTVTRWSDAGPDYLHIAVSAASGMVFLNDCVGAVPRNHCVSRGRADGSQRESIARLRGNVCEIVPSPDGTRVAIAASNVDACDELWIVDANDHHDGSQGIVVPFHVPALGAGRDRTGISSIAWSPDGSRIAVISSHEEGCWTDGFDRGDCENRLYVMDSSGRGLSRRGEATHDGMRLQWIP